MRKFSFIALLVLTSELALGQITLSIPDVNAAPGLKVIVPVSISDGEDVTAIQFALTFNTTLLSIPAEGSVLAGGALTDAAEERVTLLKNAAVALKGAAVGAIALGQREIEVAPPHRRSVGMPQSASKSTFGSLPGTVSPGTPSP